MRFDSQMEDGTTFETYSAPVYQAAGPVSLRDEFDSLPEGSETVLLVEDEPMVREVTSLILRGQGYSVLEAANGHEAVRVAQAHAGEEIHLLLIDVVMPLMGGQDAAERLREIHPEAKVLYTSGYEVDTIVDLKAQRPGTAFMQKPFTPAMLAQRVREVLDSR